MVASMTTTVQIESPHAAFGMSAMSALQPERIVRT
jgi:hypothetical protein